jgi:uncharacterized membrane protein
MKNNLEIMRAAKAQLRGKWLMAARATLVYVVILGAAGSVVPGLGVLIIGGPLMLGYIFILRSILSGGDVRVETLFEHFGNFVRSLLAFLLMEVFIAIGIFFLIVPGIVVALGLAMTMFILADDPAISATDALGKSWKMMSGHKWSLFCLMFRFFGWWCLCILTFGILSFWVQPYMHLAALNFYEELKANGEAR